MGSGKILKQDETGWVIATSKVSAEEGDWAFQADTVWWHFQSKKWLRTPLFRFEFWIRIPTWNLNFSSRHGMGFSGTPASLPSKKQAVDRGPSTLGASGPWPWWVGSSCMSMAQLLRKWNRFPCWKKTKWNGLAWLGLNKIFEKKRVPLKQLRVELRATKHFFLCIIMGWYMSCWPIGVGEGTQGTGRISPPGLGWLGISLNSHFYLPSFTLKGISCQNLGPPQ